GDKIGNINSATPGFNKGSFHLHYSVFRGTETLNGAATPKGIATSRVAAGDLLNPFARFTTDADRDPGGANPALTNTNKDPDGKTVYVTRAGTTTEVTTKTIAGNVDLIADVRDAMNGNRLSASGPHQIGYYVKALFDKNVDKHDVRTAASPYSLA